MNNIRDKMNEDEEQVYNVLKNGKEFNLEEIADKTLLGSVFDGGFFNLSKREVLKAIKSLKKTGINISKVGDKYKL